VNRKIALFASRAILAYRRPVKPNPRVLLPKKFFSFQYSEITRFFINFSEIALFGTHGALSYNNLRQGRPGKRTTKKTITQQKKKEKKK